MSKLGDVNSIVLLDDSKLEYQLSRIKSIQRQVDLGNISWQQMSDSVSESDKWIMQYGMDSQGTTRTIESLRDANVAARNSIVTQNAAIETQGLKAKLTTASLNALSIALNVGLSLAISGAINWIYKQVHAHEKQIEAAKEAAQSAKEECNNISLLLLKYYELSDAVTNNQSSKEDLLSVQSDLLQALDIEESQVESLIKKYGSLDNAINQVSLDTLKKNEDSLYEAVHIAEDELLETGKKSTIFNDDLYIDMNYSDIVEKIKELNIDGGQLRISDNDLAYFELLGDTSTVKGIKQNYEALVNLREAIKDLYAQEGQSALQEFIASDFYSDLNAEITQLSLAYDTYDNAITDLNNNLSQQEILINLQGKELPKTKEEFEQFKQTIIDNAVASNKFIGNYEEIAESIENYLAKMPQFIQYYEPDLLLTTTPQFPDYSTLADTADQTATAADSLHSAISTLNNAFAEQAEHGSISTDTMLKLAEAGYATALSFDEETGACTINTHAMQELAKAKIQNQIADLQSLKTDIASKLQNEGIIASASAQGFIDLAKAKTVAAAANGLTAEQSGAIDDFNNAEAEILALQNMLQNFDQVEAGRYSSSFSSSASKSETDYKSLLDRETSLLEKQLDANLITFSDYLDKRKSLLDDYYTAGKITAEEYYDGLSSLYESQLSSYDKVVNAVTNRIDKEIDTLEKQKEVIEESYQFKMDAVQAQIDALNKENETRKEQIALEQAQYEAERARNQRSVKQFVNGQFVYTADMNEVKAAEENLAEQEQQMEIFLLEDQIASLEQEMENATASLDNQISALEAYKEQWSEISSVYEEQQNALIAAEILGADWEAQVLSGRLATLQAFTNQYIALQQAQANAAAQATQTPTPPANNSNTGGQTTHAYYAMTRTGKTVTATPFSSSAEAWNWLVNTYGSLDAHQNYKVVQKYADGGVIGAQPGLLDFIAQAVNEDHLIAARQGERILTTSQNKQFEALVKLAPELLSMHHPLQNLSVPDSFRSLFTPASTPNITIGDIHLHNVNDVNSLSRAIIQRLPGQMMQAIHRH
ncbi:MAG: hypothetical protein IJ405_00735 [Lachnospiraceae bacterium]|nr:hypothetical protein [Lachnospiraceae bacterium]